MILFACWIEQTKNIPTSFHCASEMAVGAEVSGSDPVMLFGNAITSRIDALPRSRDNRRSNPMAKPPWGGQPCFNAFRR